MNRWIALAATFALVGCTANTPAPSPPKISQTSATSSVQPSPEDESNIKVKVPLPGFMVAAFGSVWVQSRDKGAIWRIGSQGEVTARIPSASTMLAPGRYGSVSDGLDAGFGSVWSLTRNSLVRIDPTSNRITGSIPIERPYALAIGEGAVWVICCRSRIRLVKIDPSTMRAETFANLGTSASALGVGNGYVWWGRFSEAGGMFRVDPRTAEVTDIQVGDNDRFIVPTPQWIWLINSGYAQRMDANGTAIDPRSIHKAKDSIGASYSNGTVWINAGGAVGFDAKTGAITTRLPAFSHVNYQSSGGIAQLGDHVWVADPDGDLVYGLPLGG